MPEQIKGLTGAEVAERKAAGKVNLHKETDSKSAILIIFGNVIDLPNVIVFISIFFLIIYNQARDALLISSIMIVNILVSIVQEFNARNSLRKISFLHREKVTVIRDGAEAEINFDEIVQDDILKLASGKYLYVDGELLQEDSLLLDESILTGESEYSKKSVGDQLLSGSFVVSGIGYYRAKSVGEDSYIYKLTKEARNYVAYLSPLQRQINQILKVMTYITLATITILLSANIISGNQNQPLMVTNVVSVINAMVPQGIVLALTISFIIGAVRMARRQILVQKASTIETLSGINVLCMDKTGTITENKLELVELRKITEEKFAFSAEELVKLYCSTTLEKNKTIMAIGAKLGVSEIKEVKINEQLPFTSRSKLSGIDVSTGKGRFQLLLGSLDSLETYLDPAELSKLKEQELELARKGRRNLIMLCRSVDEGSELKIETKEPGYKVLVLFSMEDKLRAGAREIVLDFIRQGIKPVIISGDHPETLKALIGQLDIQSISRIVTGKQLAEADQLDFEELVASQDICARVTPEQKLAIIKAFQKIYKYVAMIGDGVNDALAIKQANLGVAMGSGANVTKNIADVILLDDDIGKLAEVMSEGKIILVNTLRSAELLIVKNIYSLVIIIGSIFLQLSFPFYPLGLFFLAFTNGTFPVLAILADKPKNTRSIDFLPRLYKFILTSGASAGLLGILIMLFSKDIYSVEHMQGLLLGFLILVGIINYLFCLKDSYSINEIFIPGKHYLIAVLVLIIYLASMYLAPLQALLQMYKLGGNDWEVLLLLIFVYSFMLSLLGSQSNRTFAIFNAKNTGNGLSGG